MGNAFTGSVKHALKSETSHMLGALNASEFDECKTCRFLYLCGGGCRARSLYATGHLTAKDPYCTMTKTFYTELGKTMAASLNKGTHND